MYKLTAKVPYDLLEQLPNLEKCDLLARLYVLGGKEHHTKDFLARDGYWRKECRCSQFTYADKRQMIAARDAIDTELMDTGFVIELVTASPREMVTA